MKKIASFYFIAVAIAAVFMTITDVAALPKVHKMDAEEMRKISTWQEFALTPTQKVVVPGDSSLTNGFEITIGGQRFNLSKGNNSNPGTLNLPASGNFEIKLRDEVFRCNNADPSFSRMYVFDHINGHYGVLPMAAVTTEYQSAACKLE